MKWYEAYTQRHAAEGIEGRLVSQYDCAGSCDMWEVHPHGAELVICPAGTLTLHQQHPDGTTESIALAANDYAINPPGTPGVPAK